MPRGEKAEAQIRIVPLVCVCVCVCECARLERAAGAGLYGRPCAWRVKGAGEAEACKGSKGRGMHGGGKGGGQDASGRHQNSTTHACTRVHAVLIEGNDRRARVAEQAQRGSKAQPSVLGAGARPACRSLQSNRAGLTDPGRAPHPSAPQPLLTRHRRLLSEMGRSGQPGSARG